MSAGPVSTAVFVLIVLSVCAFFAVAGRRAGGTRGLVFAVVTEAIVLGVTYALAASGTLRDFESLPPVMMRMVLLLFAATVSFSVSRQGAAFAAALPLAWIVGFQVFRLPLELTMHAWYTEGALPVQMTYAGRNLDILTGILAIPVAIAAHRGRAAPWMLWGFNLLGLGLLVNIVGVAITSFPGPLRLFTEEPANRLVAEAPYVWLPAVLVQAALLGHLLLLRRLTSAAHAPATAAI